MKLTERTISSHKRPGNSPDYFLWDDDIPGFGLRCRGGARTWIFQYAFSTGAHRIQRRYKIGKFSAMAPAKARDVAADLHAKVQLGQDPAAEKKKNRSDAGNTVGKLVEQYLAFKEPELRARSLEEVKRHLEVYARPLHGLPLASVDQRVISDRLNAIAKASGPVSANRVRSSLSTMFAWAMGEGRAATNPVMYTNKREEKSRERVLTDAELRTIWQSARDDHHGTIVKLLLLTGQRRNEIAGLRWAEIDLKRNIISFSGERTKNGRPHEVPITSTVHDILERHPKSEGRDFIFGYRGGAFSGWSNPKKVLDAQVGESAGNALARWTLHDLRRTAATRMADLGIAPHIIEAVLNHISGHKAGVAGIYNRAIYTAEKASALAQWDAHVSALVGPKSATRKRA